MQQDHTKAIKGLSIANIVISALVIVLCICGMFFISIALSVAGDYVTNYSDYYDLYSEYDYYYYNSTISDSDSILLASGIINALFVWEIICAIVTMVAGIIGLRNADDKSKLGLVFGWSIAGAIVGFIGMGIVVVILFTITAVFASRDKQLYAYNAYAPQNAYYQSAQGYQPQGSAPAGQNAPVAPINAVPPVAPINTPAPQPAAQQPTGQSAGQMAFQPAAPIHSPQQAPIVQPQQLQEDATAPTAAQAPATTQPVQAEAEASSADAGVPSQEQIEQQNPAVVAAEVFAKETVEEEAPVAHEVFVENQEAKLDEAVDAQVDAAAQNVADDLEGK